MFWRRELWTFIQDQLNGILFSRSKRCLGIRGATTADENTKEAILSATTELLTLMVKKNNLQLEDVTCAIFSTTPDLNAEFPAFAARMLGWNDTALLCTHEMAVPNALSKCIRVLILWNTSKTVSEIQHVYIHGAQNLRPARTIP